MIKVLPTKGVGVKAQILNLFPGDKAHFPISSKNTVAVTICQRITPHYPEREYDSQAITLTKKGLIYKLYQVTRIK